MEIDKQLAACGWVVQDYKHAAVAAAQGVAVREVQTDAASLTVAPADLQNPPFSTHGGLGRARQLFGTNLNPLLEELTLALAA